MQLPPWLTVRSSYGPKQDRDSFLRKNILSTTSVLLVLRAEAPGFGQMCLLDRVLVNVPAAMRLVCTVALVACVSLARNMAFAWVMLVGGLVLLCLCPAARIRRVLVPAIVAAIVAFVVNVPSLLLGQMSAPVRMGAKTLVTVGMVADLAQSLGPDGLVAALRGCRLPGPLVTTVDLAIRDVVLLGDSARTLSEALELRSVGRDPTKTSSAAGVMGVTFLLAHNRAVARAEAMELRGYGFDAKTRHSKTRALGPSAATVAYMLCVLALVALFAYLEVAVA